MSDDEPRQVMAGVSTEQMLANLRGAREVLKGVVGAPPLQDDLDPEVLEQERTVDLERQRHLRWSSVAPQRFHDADVARLDPVYAEQIAEWARLSPRPNLVLCGPVGVGKTYAALAAVKEDWLARGLGVMFLPVTEALDQLRPGGDPYALENMVGVERLVLDDLGSERPTDWTAERLYVVVNRRWMEERPIIGTSNLEPGPDGPLCEALGERTYSRLVGSDAVVIRMTGDDRRRRRG